MPHPKSGLDCSGSCFANRPALTSRKLSQLTQITRVINHNNSGKTAICITMPARLNSTSLGRIGDLFPFLGWFEMLGSRRVLRADLIAGITVALVLVPQSMAYAQLAGLPPHHGLYAAFLPGIVAALFGSSRQLATGPVAVVSLMTASALEPLAGANAEAYLAYAVLLALCVGAFQFLLGVFRLGVLVDFLSHPVVLGFANAAAIIIGTSQLGKLFGVTAEKAEHQYQTVWNMIVAASTDTHLPTFAMAVLALAVMILLKRFAPKVPNVLTAVVITTTLSWAIGFTEMGGKIVGTIPEGLPSLHLPVIGWDAMLQLIGVALAISLIGFMEAISIAKAMAVRTRQRLDANQELIGQGLGNVAAALTQGYAVSGSFSRSAVNLTAGAKTGFSSVVTGVVVGATLIWLTPLLYHLPQATLAAVIIMAVINLVRIEPMLHAWKVHPHDGIVAVIVFVLTLVLAPHLEAGIMVGVVLSLVLYLFRTMRPHVAHLARAPDGTLRDAAVFQLKTCDHISIIRYDGPLYFANTGYFENKVLERVAAKPYLKYVVIDADGINEIDATGEDMLRGLLERLKVLGVELLFAHTKKQVRDILHRSGFAELLGADHFFATRTLALEYIWGTFHDCPQPNCPAECPLCAACPIDAAPQKLRPKKELTN